MLFKFIELSVRSFIHLRIAPLLFSYIIYTTITRCENSSVRVWKMDYPNEDYDYVSYSIALLIYLNVVDVLFLSKNELTRGQGSSTNRQLPVISSMRFALRLRETRRSCESNIHFLTADDWFPVLRKATVILAILRERERERHRERQKARQDIMIIVIFGSDHRVRYDYIFTCTRFIFRL